VIRREDLHQGRRGEFTVRTKTHSEVASEVRYGQQKVTPISGSRGARFAPLRGVENSWVIGMRLAERSDDACWLSLYPATESFVTGRNKNSQVDNDGPSRGLAD